MYYVPELEGFNTEEKRLNTNVANEDGQNRTDEHLDKAKPVTVKISEKIIKDENFYNKFLIGMKENLAFNPKNKIDKKSFNKKNIKVLLIECFNTNGLTGSFTDNDNQNYERFFLGSTKSKTGGKLGRRQLGRHVYMISSKLNGCFALTVEHKKNQEFMRGIQYLNKWEHENNKMFPYSNFIFSKEHPEQNENEQKPILNEKILNDFKKYTGITRGKKDYGLSVVIPEPKDDITAEKVYRNYIKRFYPSILMGNLNIVYENKTTSSKNISQILEKENLKTSKWINFFNEVYTMPVSDKHFISDEGSYNYEEYIDTKKIPEEVAEKIKKDYFAKKPVVLKLYVKIPFEKDYAKKVGEKKGCFNIAIQKIDSTEKNMSPIFLRGNLQIPNEKRHFRYSKSCFAALWVDTNDDNHLAEMLGDSEGMAHDSWNSQHDEVAQSYGKECREVFKYVKSSLNNIFTFITDRRNQVDLDTFSDDLPTIEDINIEEDKVSKEIIFDKEIVDPPPPPPPPPPSQRKMVKEIKIDGGFRIIKTEECEDENFPMKVRVRFAYRARNKNSFRCYNPELHFDLTKDKNVKISKKNFVENIETIGNGVDFLATKPDFEVDITGFNELGKKDLDVRARKLKG